MIDHRSAATIGPSWDEVPTHVDLARLMMARCGFRVRRTLNRIRSPRRIVATTLAFAFFVLYLLNGVFILSSRQPADPERLALWLSGGMVLYAIYHCVRCAWSSQAVSELELTPAEEHWLGGAPIRRSSIAVYHVGGMVIPALLKTLLLTVVLAMDVEFVTLLVVGVFCSLVLLEITRLMIARWSVGIRPIHRQRFRVAVTLVAALVVFQVIARLIAMTPIGSPTMLYVLNGFRGLGETAASGTIHWMSLPWLAPSSLAVTESIGWSTLVELIVAIGSLPLAIIALVKVDHWSRRAVLRREQERLIDGDFTTGRQEWAGWIDATPSRWKQVSSSIAPHWAGEAIAVMSRQWVSVVRYRSTIAFSFVVPTLLCLSPLATGQGIEQWFFVVGGIAMCTMLLAPPALRIDFRRDLNRMLLLRGLPIDPLSMVVGQLAIPVMITWAYQWITLVVAAALIGPGWSQWLLWTAMLNALALFTFAAENAMFLAYPHHEHAEGVAMMIRAKLAFLGKATVIAIALGMLVAWAVWCRGSLPESIAGVVFVVGAAVASWAAAVIALLVAKSCWKRYDLCHDIPPA